MSTAPVLAEVNQGPLIRKFDTADFSRHGTWILPRMMKAYPHLNDRAVATFLQNILWNNEYLCLYQDDSVALAQVMSAHSLVAHPIVWERFVWCENPEDKDQLKRAADFYTHFHRWAKSMSCEAIIVEENSDVPHDMIKDKLGRIFTRQQQFARV